MPKRSNPTEKKARKKPRRKPQVIHPVNRQHQYHAVHNSALRNSTRDTAHAAKIKEVIKEKGTSLSDARLNDLAEKYKELIKGEL
tara:strand:+ start:2406 stop:2660 length:255 start_codon:yes stop_codon:yes gene_type:complete